LVSRPDLALALTAAGLALVAGLPAMAQGTVDVAAQDNVFNPVTVNVTAGTTVRWTNSGNNPHTTTSDTGLWDSGTMNAGAVFTHTFTTPGTFPYSCTFHASLGMTGTVVVAQPSPTATTAATATDTPLPTFTATFTPAATETGTPTVEATTTVTPTATLADTATATVAATATMTETATATVEATATMTATATSTPTLTITPLPIPTCTPPPCPCGVLVGTCPNVRCEICTATAVPPTVTPSPQPTAPGVNVCDFAVRRVPPAVINAAVANPSRVQGWNQPCNPSLPMDPFFNPLRSWLSLDAISKPFHPVYNSLVFKCGCP
jgi:plastocyanin